MSQAKTIPTGESVKKFLDKVADDRKRSDSLKLIDIMTRITGEPPKMWGPSIIGFGQYHYKYASGHEGDFALVGFSPRKQAISVYIMPYVADSKEPEVDKLFESLGKHKMAKGCLYIMKLDDVNTDALEKLIEISVENIRKLYPDS
jgi:hypothetical protein